MVVWLCGLITILNWHATTLWSSTRDHSGSTTGCRYTSSWQVLTKWPASWLTAEGMQQCPKMQHHLQAISQNIFYLTTVSLHMKSLCHSKEKGISIKVTVDSLSTIDHRSNNVLPCSCKCKDNGYWKSRATSVHLSNWNNKFDNLLATVRANIAIQLASSNDEKGIN